MPDRSSVVAAAVVLAAAGVVLAVRGGGETLTRDLAASERVRPAAPPATVPAPTRVLVLGDSNLAFAELPVRAALSAAGIAGDIRAVGGIGLKEMDAFWLPLVPALVQAQDPDVVVVALGTNDSAQVADAEAFPARLDQMMEAIGNRRVVWVTHFDDRYDVALSAKRVNDAIRAAPARWTNLTVLDLAPLITANTALLVPDRVHFSSSGQEFYAQEIAVAVNQSASVPLGVPVSLPPATLPPVTLPPVALPGG